MKKEKNQELNFRFHNPNSEKAFVNLLLSVFMDVQKPKADAAIDKEIETRDERPSDT